MKQGLKKYGKQGYNAAYGEMKQLHDCICFKPININSLTPEERKKALESLIFLTEKHDRRIKGQTCANGSKQHNWMNKEDTGSPMAALKSVLITSVIDAKEACDVATMDIPNAFIQTDIPHEKGQERIILKIHGALVDMLLQIDPRTYAPYVAYEHGEKILYTDVLKAIYGMMDQCIDVLQKMEARFVI